MNIATPSPNVVSREEFDSLSDKFAVQNREIRAEFREQMRHLARAMSRNIDGVKGINRPLLGALITAFEEVNYLVCTKGELWGARGREEGRRIYILKHQHTPPHVAMMSAATDAPHKGFLILSIDRMGRLYIPHQDGNIPFDLSEYNIGYIGGAVGKNIENAFYDGLQDICQGETAKPKIRRETDMQILDHAEMEEHVSESITRLCAARAVALSLNPEQKKKLVEKAQAMTARKEERRQMQLAEVARKKAEKLEKRAQRRREQEEKKREEQAEKKAHKVELNKAKAEVTAAVKKPATARSPQASGARPTWQDKSTFVLAHDNSNTGKIIEKREKRKRRPDLMSKSERIAEIMRVAEEARINARVQEAARQAHEAAIKSDEAVRQRLLRERIGTRQKQFVPARPAPWYLKMDQAELRTSHS